MSTLRMSLFRLQEQEDWKKEASCRGKPVSWFFEDYERSVEVQLKVDAMCAGCPVRQRCDQFAQDMRVEGGVYARKWYDYRSDFEREDLLKDTQWQKEQREIKKKRKKSRALALQG